jgi:hypothetical protein
LIYYNGELYVHGKTLVNDGKDILGVKSTNVIDSRDRSLTLSEIARYTVISIDCIPQRA